MINASGTSPGAWHHVKWRLQLLRSVMFLAAMSFLDVRDLWYKLTWIGPYDAYAFDAGSRGTLLSTPLPPSMTLPTKFTPFDAPIHSGWPSYLSRCQNMTAFCSPGSTFFLNAMGTNCDVGVLNETKTIDRLVMTSNVRSDSMAWAACQLLYGNRRPTICQEHIVSNFLFRYGFLAKPIESEWMALPGSAAEAELVRFLELIAMSHPHDRIICTGGFEYSKPGRYLPTIFGCASANVYRAEYVGIYATKFHELAYDKAWLTAIDIITLVDISYKIRQNTINVFDMEEETVADGSVAISVTETTANNFVSSGLLYVLMILVDSILLLAQMYTAMELVTQWIIPAMRKRDDDEFVHELQEHEGQGGAHNIQATAAAALAEDEASFTQEEYTSFLSSSLYRHPVVIVLTVISQFISWGIIIPNSVVWTWSLSNYSKVMAFFSSLRIWTLILVGVNFVWDIVVFWSEKYAYMCARATYATTWEIMAIGAIFAFSKKDAVMAISEAKFGIEHQRTNDVFSFPTYIAHGNTFNGDLDFSPNSQGPLLNVMYMPLIHIVFNSILGTFGWLVIKAGLLYLKETPSVTRTIYQMRRAVGLKAALYHAPGADAELRRKSMMNSAHFSDPLDRNYSRVALERIVNMPMRARSLVRPTMSMQKTFNGETVLRPAVHLDFGVFVHDRKVSARSGFESTVRAVATLPAPRLSKKSRTITIASINATSAANLDELEEKAAIPNRKNLEITEEDERLQAARKSKLLGKGFAIVHASQ